MKSLTANRMIKYFYLIFIAALLPTLNICATIIDVPSDYVTIQAAIHASSDGDTVLVEPGTYYENINFRSKRIVLTSRFYLNKDTSYICTTIIDGSQPVFPDTASCIILNSGEDSTTIIQGFTITGGTGTKWLDIHGAGVYREGGGIITEFSSPVIRWNNIINNLVLNATGVSSTGGGGLRCGDGHPRIYNNVIAYNQGSYGGGLVFNFCNNAEIRNNLIVNNSGGQSFGGGGIWATGTNTSTVLIVENNTIANNHVTGTGSFGGRGGGIFVFSITLNINNNIIWGNTQSSGNSIAIFTGGVVHVTYTILDFVFSGTGNIVANPLFSDTITYSLSSFSPCIDAGDTSSVFNDLTVSLNVAAFPSQGGERNDIGAYGGPFAMAFPSCSLGSASISETNNWGCFLVTPNPIQDYLIIHSLRGQILDVEIISTLGDKILKQKTESNKIIYLAKFPTGIYLLMIAVEGKFVLTKKIMLIN
jgi:hypothetical protein